VNRKLVVFVPREALDTVREALFAAGAGRIGNYERCSWYTEGTGTFLGGESTAPSVGQPGREERVAELRLETVYPSEREMEVVNALRDAHPYEEPAFDLYVLADSVARATTTMSEVKARLSTDGGSRGNPGPAAYGYVLEAEDGTVLDARGETIGVATNNVAEYRALLAGLGSAVERGIDDLEVVSDSELLVRQMRGEYKVKSATLRELVDEAQALAGRLGSVRFTAVRREHNELADRLVNEALDSAT
jgi:ribonuclease HI